MSWGHDIEKEGLHMDIYKDGHKKDVIHGFEQVPLNHAVDYCERYLLRTADKLVDQYEAWHGLNDDYI